MDGILYSKDKSSLLCCPGGKKGTLTIPKGVKVIGYDAFNSCNKLTDITIPEGVTKIGENAILHCSKLKSVTIPKSVTEIDEHSLWNIDTDDTWVIKGYSGSQAEKYAKDGNIKFEKLNGEK